jgi:hypothetical protein
MKNTTWSTPGVLAFAALVLAFGDANLHANQRTAEERAMHRFEHAVSTYATLHRQLERSVPPLGVTDDVYALYAATEALAHRIREARAQAREGDIFDPEVGQFLRTRIQQVLGDYQIAIDELLAEIMLEVPPGLEPPRTNERFPWDWGAAIPVCLLDVLPELPEELEYRFAGRDLVLIDIHAELVVDVLRRALPPPNPRGILTSAPNDPHDLGVLSRQDWR